MACYGVAPLPHIPLAVKEDSLAHVTSTDFHLTVFEDESD